MIFYSVLLSGFEKLDFKDDALAGVRANYFNANRSPQSDDTELSTDGGAIRLRYAMKNGEPLSWKMTQNHQPRQTVARVSAQIYCVMSYTDNGVVWKRAYYDTEHLWQRTDYFSPENEGRLAAVVTPCRIDGVWALRVEKPAADGSKTRAVLFPSERHRGLQCTALAYSNTGMLWYDVRFAPSAASHEEQPRAQRGFSFTPEDFTTPSAAPLDLLGAPPLSQEDVAAATAPLTEEIAEEERPYSAYDRIESILLEAQKTNKNIFGAIAGYAEEKEPPAEEETVAEEESAAEPIYETAPEENAALELKTPGGVYAYYGELDENSRRTGRGRTVAPDGTPVYEGDYRLDMRSGFGVCYYKDGSPNYAGDWVDGARSGRGVGFRRSDGTIHVGKWHDNKPGGLGARFDSEGSFLDVCGYENGVRHGKGISFDEEGRILIRVWENGELISERVIDDEE